MEGFIGFLAAVATALGVVYLAVLWYGVLTGKIDPATVHFL